MRSSLICVISLAVQKPIKNIIITSKMKCIIAKNDPDLDEKFPLKMEACLKRPHVYEASRPRGLPTEINIVAKINFWLSTTDVYDEASDRNYFGQEAS